MSAKFIDVAQLESELDQTRADLTAALAERDAARERVAECERDASRYRWLREKSSRQSMTGKKHSGQIQVIQWSDRTEANVLTYAALDAAIDAALKGDAHD